MAFSLELTGLLALSESLNIPTPKQVLVYQCLHTGFCGSESIDVVIIDLDFDSNNKSDVISKDLWQAACDNAESHGYYPPSDEDDEDEDDDDQDNISEDISGYAHLATIDNIESCYGWQDGWKEILESNHEWLKQLFPVSDWPYQDNVTPYYVEHPKYRLNKRITQCTNQLHREQKELDSLETKSAEIRHRVQYLTDEIDALKSQL